MMDDGVEGDDRNAMPTSTVGHIFRIIRDRGPLNPADIVRLTGLAKSTVSVNVERLLGTGLVREEVRAGSKRRRLKVDEKAGFVAGVDIGQTHLAVGLLDLEAAVLARRREPIELAELDPESVLDRVAGLVRELASEVGADPGALFGIGVGVPGPVDFERGIAVSPPVMPGWDRFPVASYLSEEFGCPVFLDNDVNVMALGERDRGDAGRNGGLLWIKIGTGIGAGIVSGGEIWRGAKGAAGDIGHIGIDGDDTPCRCGNRGCLEAVAGGKAISTKALEAARSGASPFLARELGKKELPKPELVARGAVHGDEVCLSILMDSARTVGNVLAKLVNFWNPSLIIVGGGIVSVGERYVASIREVIYRRSTPLATADLVVRKTALGDDAGIIGAAVLVLDEVFSHQNVGRLVRRDGRPDGRSESS